MPTPPRRRVTPSRRTDGGQSSHVMSTIDELLQANEDMRLEQGFDKEKEDARRAQINARIEEVFPGVTEDEQTPSGIYEPSREHFPSNYVIGRPTIEQKFMEPLDISSDFTNRRTESGTGPALSAGRLHRFRVHRGGNERFRIPLTDDDLDERTPEFGTSRASRTYAGFEGEAVRRANPHAIDSPEYWDKIDTYHQNVRRTAHMNEEIAVLDGFREWLPGMAPARAESSDSNRASRGIRQSPRQRRSAIQDAAARGVTGADAFAGARRGRGNVRRGTFSSLSGIPDFSGARSNHHPSVTDRASNEGTHAIYSYDTPIAWREGSGDNHRWILDETRYSNTSGRHREAIRQALFANNYRPVASSDRLSVFHPSTAPAGQPVRVAQEDVVDDHVADWAQQRQSGQTDLPVSEYLRRRQNG